MSFKVDPKTTSLIPRDLLAEGKSRTQAGADKPKYLRAMEKPKLMATPDLAATAPRAGAGRRATTRVGPAFQQRALELLAKMAARRASAAASLYTMRRSKGSRRRGFDLLEAAAEADPENAELAVGLRHVLLAEAYLHETSGDATLRAVRALIGMLDDEEDDEGEA